jgi:hypothetical protein
MLKGQDTADASAGCESTARIACEVNGEVRPSALALALAIALAIDKEREALRSHKKQSLQRATKKKSAGQFQN